MRRLWLLVLLASLAACAPLPASEPVVGALAPDFTLPMLDGSTLRLSELRGQRVLLNFWATWCGPCREEMPAIEARYNQGDFAVVAINFAESNQQVQGFLAEIGVELPVALDRDGAVQELYRVRGYPTSFLVDAQGVIRAFHIGELNVAQLDRYLQQMDAN